MSNKTKLIHAIHKESLDLTQHTYNRLLDEFSLMSYSIYGMLDLPEEKLQQLLDTIRKETR